MNGEEQRRHRTATQEIRKDLDAVTNTTGELVDELVTRISQVRDECLKAVGEERTHRLRLAEQQRTYVDRGDKDNLIRMSNFVCRGFWSRLNWLFTGR